MSAKPDRELIASLTANRTFFTKPPAHGDYITVGSWKIHILYDPDLPTLGLTDTEYAGGVIRLREWNERVFLHEILHVLLNRWLSKIEGEFDGKPAWEKAVQQVEDALWDMGWRWVL